MGAQVGGASALDTAEKSVYDHSATVNSAQGVPVHPARSRQPPGAALPFRPLTGRRISRRPAPGGPQVSLAAAGPLRRRPPDWAETPASLPLPRRFLMDPQAPGTRTDQPAGGPAYPPPAPVQQFAIGNKPGQPDLVKRFGAYLIDAIALAVLAYLPIPVIGL